MNGAEARLKELGVELPQVPAPLAQYVPAKLVGDLAMTSGQVPSCEGGFLHTGKVGAGVTLEEGRACARLCAINALAAIRAVIGSLDRVAEVVSLRGFVSSAPDFYQQPEVVNGASELMVEVFGEAGKHVRSAVGVCPLPRDVPVELEVVVRVTPD